MCYKNEYQKRAHGEVEQIFRELLPEAGLHVREEQIRLCHEMLDALMKNEITLCDAGHWKNLCLSDCLHPDAEI